MHSFAKCYIDTISELQEWCDRNKDIALLGIDTEFMRVKTYFPKLCLIQLSTCSEMVVIDPIKIKDLSPLIGLLGSQNVVKIIHSASQDLETLFAELKMMPAPIFDTQIAAHCLNFSDEGLLISYQGIVHLLLNVIIEKDQTRTDWTQRPLTAEQVEYAYDDVRFLIALYQQLNEQLTIGNHQSKFNSLMKGIVDPLKYTPQLESVWKKVKHKNQLKGRKLTLLKHLAFEREKLAMEKNLPKRWVITDEQLIELATLYGAQIDADTEQLIRTPILKSLKKEISGQIMIWIAAFNQ